VIVETHAKMVVDGCVDQTESILLAGCEGNFVVCSASSTGVQHSTVD
jgi:hypothetical protein